MSADPFDPQWDDPPPAPAAEEPPQPQRIVVNGVETWVHLRPTAPPPAALAANWAHDSSQYVTPTNPKYNEHFKQVIISLQDVVTYLREAVREYGLELARRRGGAPQAYFHNYTSTAFMTQLVSEIFASPGQEPPLYQELESTQILIRLGIERDTARLIAAQAFNGVVDSVVAAIPSLPFGEQEQLQYSLWGEHDLSIWFDIRWLEENGRA